MHYRIVGSSKSFLRGRLVTGRLVKIATCTVISPLCFYYPQHETVIVTDPEYGFAFSQLLCYFPLPRMTAWDDETSSSPEPTGGQSSVRSHLPFSLDLSVAQILASYAHPHLPVFLPVLPRVRPQITRQIPDSCPVHLLAHGCR